MLIFGIYIRLFIGSKPKSLIEVAKMVSGGRNQASTATTNLLFSANGQVTQIFRYSK